MLGVDCIARKGYIAAFESLINFNPNSQIEYTVSSFVYIFLALTLVLFFISYGWQHFFNLMLPGILDAKKKKAAQKKMEEQQRAEYQAQLEAYQNAQAQQTQQTQQGQQGQQGQ
jgi:phosphotransferase system  glucose/maltose/N-acetylglucosamine-specific IIC component